MANRKPHRIAITGPESTGKSWLCEQLAIYFNEPWVPEYSREYLSQINGEYSFGDILAIAHGQFAREVIEQSKARDYLFCDTDFVVNHIWCMVKYGKSHDWIMKTAEDHPYTYTLLCNIDLPWKFDPLRENPHNRQEIFNLFKKELDNRNLPYNIINGTGDDRLANAINLLAEAGIKRHQ